MLPLRLSVEPFLRTSLGAACFILPSADEENLCFAISNHGLVAFVMNHELTPQDLGELTQLPQAHWPRYSIVRSQSKSEFLWYFNGNQCQKIPSQEEILTSLHDQPLTRPVAKMILESITRYYARQVLEPSIRGFLGILEKQFPRNDLYLFELLQNSVDDGASMVILKSFGLTSDSPGLFFCHNGRSFSPLDILGLASVGLSTKGTEEKKKIGFMGVGFKAVYKRFGSVTIYDHIWSLQFREPRCPPAMEPSHSWVLKPNWLPEYPALDSIIPKSENVVSQTWCHFVLQEPRGGVNAIRSDLSHLSFNVPVLLGRQYLLTGERSTRDWTLIWENTKYEVACREQSILLPSGTVLESLLESTSGKFVCGNFDRVQLSISSYSPRHPTEKKKFQFLTVFFHPTCAAQEAFQMHTKKKWSSQAGITSTERNHILTEEISLFFEIGESGLPTMRTSSGKIHAILPTKLVMPCPINLQASWLLSVDRQDVQNIAENDWNNCLINQLPRLLILLSRWIANQVEIINSSRDVSLSLKSLYRLFPKFIFDDSELKTLVMGHEIAMKELVHSFKEENLIPVRSINEKTHSPDSCLETIRFCTQSETIWLPAPMMRFLTAKVVFSWFGRWPFVSREIDDLALDSIWTTSLVKPTVDLFVKRKSSFFFPNEIMTQSSRKVREALTILAALGAMQQNCVDETEKNLIPRLESWPIFLTDNGKMAVAQEVVWLDFDEFNSALEAPIFSTLRRGALLASLKLTSSSTARNSKVNSKDPQVPLYLLDTHLEQALLQESSPDLPSEVFLLAKDCVKCARSLSPSRVIGIDTSCSAILATMALEQKNVNSKLDIPLLQYLFHWALKNSRPLAISYLLVNKKTGLKLVPSNESYIQSTKSSDSQALDLLPYVSDIYLQEVTRPSDQYLQNYRSFLVRCGCQTGLSLVAQTRPINAVDKSYLLGAELPKLRQSNPSVPLSLPFNLGPLTRKKVEILDVVLSPEWEAILRSAENDISLAEHISEMICFMLKSLDAASIISAETTPYLSNLLQGRATEEASNYSSSVIDSDIHKSSSHRVPSDIEKFPPPAFVRMFFLPPAQPGAEVRNLGPAGWISTLAHSKWVPAVPAGSEETSPSLVLAPCEVLLTKAATNPLVDIMPLAKLDDHQIRVLLNLDPILSSLFAWGTVAPPPPLERFERLCKDQSFVGQLEDEMRGSIDCSRAKYIEISNIWLSLLLAFQERRLSDRDRSRLLKALNQDQHRRIFILPGFTPNTLLSISRCISTSSSSSLDRDEDVVTSLLCQNGYLYDLHVPPETLPRADEWVLSSYRSYLIDFLALPKYASTKQISDYLVTYFSHVISKNKYLAPTSVQKLAFSYSLWMLAKEHLTSSEIQLLFRSSYPSQLIETIRSRLKKRFLEFAVYCTHGHGLEHSNLPGEWIILWSTNTSSTASEVHPVLIDDHLLGPKGCGVLKSSLLKKEHHFEPLAILDHCLHRQQAHFSPRLLDIEAFLRVVLDIPSISDPKYFSLSAKSGGGQEPLIEASERFQVIVALLHLLDFHHIRTGTTIHIVDAPIFKCNSLSLVFRFPKLIDQKICGLAESHIFPVYAIRGAPIKSKSQSPDCDNIENQKQKVQSLLVTGSPHDYVPELEELLLLLLYGNHRPSSGISTSNVRKALSLLNHLESGNEFLKYFERYFADLFDFNLSIGAGDLSLPGTGSTESSFSKYQNDLLEAVKKVKGRQRKLPPTHDSVRIENIPQREEKQDGPSMMPLDQNRLQTKTESISKLEDIEIERKNLGAAELFLSSIPTITTVESAPDVPVEPLLRGQGRGICNLPSWVTSPENQVSTSMTFPQKRARDEEEAAFHSSPQPVIASSEESSLVSCTHPATDPIHAPSGVIVASDADVLDISKGRGRGISNLPAWMTFPPEAIEEKSKTQEFKRSRPSCESEEQFEDAAPVPEIVGTPSQRQTQFRTVEREFSFDSLLTDLLDLISLSAKFSLDLPFTSSKLISTLSSVPQLQRIDLENSLTGPLRQELLAALTVVQVSPGQETRFQRLCDYLSHR